MLHDAGSNADLRAELERIVHQCPQSEHASRIAALQESFKHSISLLAAANAATEGYNCYMYALELQDPPPVLVRLALRYDAFPDSCFVAHLIATRQLQAIDAAQVKDGDITIYFGGSRPAHAGKIRSGLIESKWGCFDLWRHRVFEVPSRYGDRVRLYPSG